MFSDVARYGMGRVVFCCVVYMDLLDDEMEDGDVSLFPIEDRDDGVVGPELAAMPIFCNRVDMPGELLMVMGPPPIAEPDVFERCRGGPDS